MFANTFGTAFRVTTFGESHGPALGAVVDGCPPGLLLDERDIQPDLDRRRPGQSKHTTQRREADAVRILSGVFEGRTTGTPIALIIENTDQRSRDYSNIQTQFRPAHADFTYISKYGLRDYRGGGRASARETAARVAAGAIARKFLSASYGVRIQGAMVQMGDICAEKLDWDQVDNNAFFSPDPDCIAAMETLIEQLRRDGDSIGARVTVRAQGVPSGWGEPVFAKLDAEIASALMGINAVRGVEMGDGFDVVNQRGSEHRDERTAADGFLSNHAGGTLGGISSGQDIVASIALKPTSSIRIPGRSTNEEGEDIEVVTTGRHDPCVGIRAVPIAEAMLALVLMDHALRDRGQTGRAAQEFPSI